MKTKENSLKYVIELSNMEADGRRVTKAAIATRSTQRHTIFVGGDDVAVQIRRRRERLRASRARMLHCMTKETSASPLGTNAQLYEVTTSAYSSYCILQHALWELRQKFYVCCSFKLVEESIFDTTCTWLRASRIGIPGRPCAWPGRKTIRHYTQGMSH